MSKVILMLIALTLPAYGTGVDKGPTPGNGFGKGTVKGVPIPMAGAGLIPLAVFGLWVVRRRWA